MKRHTILFLAANPSETDPLALDREARAIQVELERSRWRDRFELVTRWAAEPLDLLRELRRLAPTVVQFSGHGGALAQAGPLLNRDVVGDHGRPEATPCHGLFFQGADGRPRMVSAGALGEVFGAGGASVKLVILNACYSEPAADALLAHVDCVVGMAGSIGDHAARSFAVGFYGGLGERASIEAAFRGGCAAIGLEGYPDGTLPRLKVRLGANAGQLILAALAPAEPGGSTAAQPQVPAGPTPSGVPGSSGPPRKVFVSHSSIDKPTVKDLVDALRARGIDAWYDDYEIGPGDDIVAKLNEGLASRDVGLVIFSANTNQGRWVSREISTLFYERVEDDKVLIPVILGDGSRLPPLIKPLARVEIEDVDRIVDAIHHRRVKPPLGTATRPAASHAVVLSLARDATGAIQIAVALDGSVLASCTHAALPRDLVALRDDFLSGFRHATLRSPLAIERRAKEASIAALGRAMAAFCLPGPAALAIGAVLDGDGQIPGASIEIAISTDAWTRCGRGSNAL